MAQPLTREDFKEYCLRALGKGVLAINVSEEQIEDRVDEAFYMYQQFHSDAVVKTWMKHKITPSTLRFDAANTVNGVFVAGEALKGLTSNTTVTVHAYDTGVPRTLYFYSGGSVASPPSVTDNSYSDTAYINGLLDGEIVEGQKSLARARIGTTNSSFITNELGDMDNRWVPMPQAVIGVNRVLPLHDSRIGADILFDPQSQFNMALLSSFTSNSIIPYYVGRQYQQLLNDTFRGRPGMRFQRHMNRLYIDISWVNNVRIGDWWLIEGARVIDPDTFPDIYGDRWLQKYTQALLKKQWATNLSKFGGIQLPGGVTLNAKDMLEEANLEIETLEKQLQDTHQLPIDFVVG